MVHKVQDWEISSQNRVYHLYKSVAFSRNWLRRPETGMKNGFEEMEHEFPFGICYPEKQDYLFRCSVAGGNFPLGRLKKVVYHLLLSWISRRLL